MPAGRIPTKPKGYLPAQRLQERAYPHTHRSFRLPPSRLVLCLLFMAYNCYGSATATALEPQALTDSGQAAPPAVEFGENELDSRGSSAPNGVAFDDIISHAENSTGSDSTTDPSEVQKAVCTVTAGEVKASAEAVTTKTLKGVCGSAEMNFALRNLESKLYKELQEIKTILLQMNAANGLNHRNAPKVEIVEATTTSPGFQYHEHFTELKTQKEESTIVKTQTVHAPSEKRKAPSMPKLKSLTHSEKPRSPQREQEVSKFNNTMLADRDIRVFAYYWKLENFTERIESRQSATVESPTFTIKGKPLHIKASFQHLKRDFMYLQLEYASLKGNASKHNNIILEMGGLFKEITNEKVNLKHKISILDQNNQHSKDLVSQEFNNLETGFLIPNSALLASPYVKNGALLIQIFLYL